MIGGACPVPLLFKGDVFLAGFFGAEVFADTFRDDSRSFFAGDFFAEIFFCTFLSEVLIAAIFFAVDVFFVPVPFFAEALVERSFEAVDPPFFAAVFFVRDFETAAGDAFLPDSPAEAFIFDRAFDFGVFTDAAVFTAAVLFELFVADFFAEDVKVFPVDFAAFLPGAREADFKFCFFLAGVRLFLVAFLLLMNIVISPLYKCIRSIRFRSSA